MRQGHGQYHPYAPCVQYWPAQAQVQHYSSASRALQVNYNGQYCTSNWRDSTTMVWMKNKMMRQGLRALSELIHLFSNAKQFLRATGVALDFGFPILET